MQSPIKRPEDAPSAVGCASSLGRESGVGGDTVTGDTSCDTHIVKSNRGKERLHRGGVEIEGIGRKEEPEIQGGTMGRRRCSEQMRDDGERNEAAYARACVYAGEGAPRVP